MSEDRLGTVRFRSENGLVDIYVKTSENRWAVTYTSPTQSIEGHVSDPVATRWPVLFAPEDVGGNPK